MKKSAVSAANMEVLLVHAVVQPKARTHEVPAETRAAELLGAHLMGVVRDLPGVRTWRARAADGRQIALQVMADAASPEEKANFAKAVSARKTAAPFLVGVLPVYGVAGEGEAFETDLLTTGTAKDLPALEWPIKRRLEFVAGVAAALKSLHDTGIVHGSLCLDNVLLDDRLQPVLSEAGLVLVQSLRARDAGAVYETFTAPELREGAAPDVRSDIFSLGRLLQEIAGKDADKAPNVAEIVRRATAPLAIGRFPSAALFGAALDLAIEAIPAETTTIAAPPVPAEPKPKREAPRPTFDAEASRVPAAPWRAPMWLGLVGVAAMGGAIAAAALLGGSSDALRKLLVVAVPVGAALVTTLLPPLPQRSALARVALAVGVAVLVLAVDPLSFAYRMAAQARMRGGPAAQRAAVTEILRLGRDFRGLSLSGAELGGLDLTGADLRGVSLAGADLTGARLFAAEIDGASFDGAQVAGADLSGVTLALASTADTRCDGATKVPQGWRCIEGRLGRY